MSSRKRRDDPDPFAPNVIHQVRYPSTWEGMVPWRHDGLWTCSSSAGYPSTLTYADPPATPHKCAYCGTHTFLKPTHGETVRCGACGAPLAL